MPWYDKINNLKPVSVRKLYLIVFDTFGWIFTKITLQCLLSFQ